MSDPEPVDLDALDAEYAKCGGGTRIPVPLDADVVGPMRCLRALQCIRNAYPALAAEIRRLRETVMRQEMVLRQSVSSGDEGRICLLCQGPVPSGARYKHGVGVCTQGREQP